MSSLVTGGAGFLGSYIVKALQARGEKVTVVARRFSSELDLPGVSQVAVDIRNPKELETAFKGVEQVFHVAARVGVWGPWEEFFQTNVVGTENVLSACARNGVRRLIFTSSPSVVFDGSAQQGVDESYPYAERWLSPYPRSKKLAEEKVLAASGKDGLLTVALRPHLIWGKGDKFLLPRVIEQARRKKLLRVGTGKNRVDIVHVRNAAEAHLLAADRLAKDGGCAGKAYFISQGEPVALWDFIGEVLQRAGAPPVKKGISFRTAYQLGTALEWGHRFLPGAEEPRMTRFLAHQLAKDHWYNISAAERDLGYRAKVTTSQGLDEMFGSC